MIATKKDYIESDTSRSSHKTTSFLSSFNGQARRRVFGGTHECEDMPGAELPYPHSTSHMSKGSHGLPIMSLARPNSLADKIEAINDRRLAEASSKIDQLHIKLAEL